MSEQTFSQQASQQTIVTSQVSQQKTMRETVREKQAAYRYRIDFMDKDMEEDAIQKGIEGQGTLPKMIEYVRILGERAATKHRDYCLFAKTKVGEIAKEEYLDCLADYRDYMINILAKVGEALNSDPNTPITDEVLHIVNNFCAFQRNDSLNDEGATAQYKKYVSSLICRLCTIGSGKELMSNIFDKRYLSKELCGDEIQWTPTKIMIQNPLLSGGRINNPSAAYNKIVFKPINDSDTKGDDVFQEDSAHIDSAKITLVEGETVISTDDKKIETVRVTPPMQEYVGFLKDFVALAPGGKQISETDLKDYDVVMLGHELIHALHHGYGVANSSRTKCLESENPLEKQSLEEVITAGVKVAKQDYLSPKSDKSMDEIAFSSADKSVKAAFEVSENSIREEYGISRRFSYSTSFVDKLTDTQSRWNKDQVAMMNIAEQVIICCTISSLSINTVEKLTRVVNQLDKEEALSSYINSGQFKKMVYPEMMQKLKEYFITDGRMTQDDFNRLTAYEGFEEVVTNTIAECTFIWANKNRMLHPAPKKA